MDTSLANTEGMKEDPLQGKVTYSILIQPIQN
jgi:hypothetical protein